NRCARSPPHLDGKKNTRALPHWVCFSPWRATQGSDRSVLGTSFGEWQSAKVLRSRIIGVCKNMNKSYARAVLGRWLRSLNEGTFTPLKTTTFQEFYEKGESDLLPTYRESTRHF